MLAEDRGRTRIIERGAKAHPLGDFRHGPPIGLSLTRGRRKGALARDSPLGICHRPVFFSPGRGGQEHMRARPDRIGRAHIIRNDEEIELGQRRAHFIGARQADRRIGGHDPQRLDAALRDGLEHRDGLEALALGHARRAPEAANTVESRPAKTPYARQADWRGRRLRARPSRSVARSRKMAPRPECRCGRLQDGN